MEKPVLKFKSKIDWLVAIVYLALIGAFLAVWLIPYQGAMWMNIIASTTLGIVTIIFTWAVFSTYYLLTDEYLIAVTGPFKMRVSYRRIKDVKPNRSSWSSFSLSFDRVVLICGTTIFQNYYFSPKNKDIFIKELKKRIDNIQ